MIQTSTQPKTTIITIIELNLHLYVKKCNSMFARIHKTIRNIIIHKMFKIFVNFM